MSDVWAYRTDLENREEDLVGYAVEAEDGHIGKVDKSTIDADYSHLVVDTGFWIFGKKRMIPAGVITRIDPSTKSVSVNMTKDEIKGAPDWNDTTSELHATDKDALRQLLPAVRFVTRGGELMSADTATIDRLRPGLEPSDENVAIEPAVSKRATRVVAIDEVDEVGVAGVAPGQRWRRPP